MTRQALRFVKWEGAAMKNACIELCGKMLADHNLLTAESNEG